MIKKTITYTDYEGIQHTDDFYFNLSRAELIKMEYSIQGGLMKKIEKLSKSVDPTQIMPLFSDIILKSYGVKSDDGKRFIKSKELSEEFSQTEAYSELLVELFSDPDKAGEFIRGLANLGGGANIEALPSPDSVKIK